jgi:hypothetical protein
LRIGIRDQQSRLLSNGQVIGTAVVNQDISEVVVSDHEDKQRSAGEGSFDASAGDLSNPTLTRDIPRFGDEEGVCLMTTVKS